MNKVRLITWKVGFFCRAELGAPGLQSQVYLFVGKYSLYFRRQEAPIVKDINQRPTAHQLASKPSLTSYPEITRTEILAYQGARVENVFF